jgi:ABC-type cobalt transport system substrate-binding protein
LYNGRIIAISESAETIYDGSYTVSDNNISGSLRIYESNGNGEPFATAIFSGTVTEQESMSLSFDTSYINGTIYYTRGTVSLSFNDIYNRKSSLELVEGTWNYTSDDYSITITVQSDGTYWGQDSDGCVISGSIGLLNTSHNLYDMNTSIESCGETNGSYTGFSFLTDNVATNDTLQGVVSNSNYIILYSFTK